MINSFKKTFYWFKLLFWGMGVFILGCSKNQSKVINSHTISICNEPYGISESSDSVPLAWTGSGWLATMSGNTLVIGLPFLSPYSKERKLAINIHVKSPLIGGNNGYLSIIDDSITVVSENDFKVNLSTVPGGTLKHYDGSISGSVSLVGSSLYWGKKCKITGSFKVYSGE